MTPSDAPRTPAVFDQALPYLGVPARLAQILCEPGVDVNAHDAIGRTLLYHLACVPADALTRAHLDSVGMLVRAGARADGPTPDGPHPLLGAAVAGNGAMVAELLHAGADMNQVGANGWTALHIACIHTNASVTEALIAAGADIDVVDSLGWTQLHWAVKRAHTPLVEALAKAGADVNAPMPDRSGFGLTPLQFAVKAGDGVLTSTLLAAGADADKTPRDTLPALHMAVLIGRETLEVLLEGGANEDIRNAKGASALHLAVTQSRTDIARSLIAAGVSMQAWDVDKCTPLMYAATVRSLPSIEVLLSAGADPDARDCQGNTFWDWARSNLAPDMFEGVKAFHKAVQMHDLLNPANAHGIGPCL